MARSTARGSAPGQMPPLFWVVLVVLFTEAVALPWLAARLAGQDPQGLEVFRAYETRPWQFWAVLVALIAVNIAAVVVGSVWWNRHNLNGYRAKAARMGRGRDVSELTKTPRKNAARLGFTKATPGLRLGDSVVGGVPLWLGGEGSALVYAGPGSGKTAALAAPMVLDAPAWAVVTGNKADIVDVTAPVRPGSCWVMDTRTEASSQPPRWFYDPLVFIQGPDPESRARKLAGIFAAATAGPEPRDGGGKHYYAGGRDWLAALLLAAWSDGCDLLRVAAWLQTGTDQEPETILTAHGYSGTAGTLRGFRTNPNERERGSLLAEAQKFTAWTSNNLLRRWWSPGDARTPFDPSAFVQSTDTLYLLTQKGTDPGAPLTAALTNAVMTAGQTLAGAQGGRLDRPGVFILDEAANTCPIPDLPEFYTYFRGLGMLLVTFLQTPGQGRTTWGDEPYATLASAATVWVYAGGVKDVRDLRDLSQLVGQHTVQEASASSTRGSRSGSGSSTSTQYRDVDTLSVDDLAGLPAGLAVVIPARGRATMAQLRYWFRDHPQRKAIQKATTNA
jgi:hypothetical protein